MEKGHHGLHKLSAAGLLVTLGIIYGDIGTSPLYVLNAIIGRNPIDSGIIKGAISCIFWTLTLQTTIKYVILTLRADNNGEGGIFSLYALIRKAKIKWLLFPAIIGGCTLLADGIITPPISVSSAIEGVKTMYPSFEEKYIMYIVILILTLLFAIQQFGTKFIGKFFGPVMFVWFAMLGGLGLIQTINNVDILSALNPYYAYHLLTIHPEGFFVLGFVFLCTTGAEALYSDMGHCGRKNIRISWIFVKTALVLNTTSTETTIEIPQTGQIYILSADQLTSKNVKCNGVELKLNADDTIPVIPAKKIKKGTLKLAQQTSFAEMIKIIFFC